MPRMRLLSVLGALVVAAVAPPTAFAAFFAGQPVDGPSPDIVSVGGVDLARDGSGALVYVKNAAGTAHVFGALLVGGRWQPPARLDPGLPLPSSAPVVAVANGGQVVLAFVNGGQLYTTTRDAGASAWPTPVAIAGNAATPSIDLSVNGVGYVVWSSSGDVRAATLPRTATTWSPLDAPVDIDPGADAGSGQGAPRVTAAADGSALAAWGENGHVYARRLFGTRQSTLPQQVDVATLAGHTGGAADSPRVDIADDASFAWVAFREAFDNGASTQVLARRLVGSAFDPPQTVGAGFAGEGADAPALDIAGAGWGVFAADSSATHSPWGAEDYTDVFHPAARLGGGSAMPSDPQVAVGENARASIAWLQSAGASAPVTVHARGFSKARAADGDTALSDPAAGSVDPTAGFAGAADRYGDAVFGFVQGTGAARRLMVATWDHPPGYFGPASTGNWRQPDPLRWQAVPEAWGPIAYTVVIDGKVIGSTTSTSFPVAGRVADGVHRWRVAATDPRGQRSSTSTRTLRLDGTPPHLRVIITGRRVAGSALRFRSLASDAASGVVRVSVRYGDGSSVVLGSDVRHAFAAGHYTVTVTATDAAGNRAAVTHAVAVR